MKTHKQLLAKWRKDPAFRVAFDEPEEEFALFDELLEARSAAKLTQSEVAKRMGTQVPAVSRLESAGGKGQHSPSISTLRKYAEAVGCRLVVRLEPTRRKASVSRKSRSNTTKRVVVNA